MFMLLSYFKSQRTEMQGGYIICPGRHCERWGELVSKLMTTHPALCHRGISWARDHREKKSFLLLYAIRSVCVRCQAYETLIDTHAEWGMNLMTHQANNSPEVIL